MSKTSHPPIAITNVLPAPSYQTSNLVSSLSKTPALDMPSKHTSINRLNIPILNFWCFGDLSTTTTAVDTTCLHDWPADSLAPTLIMALDLRQKVLVQVQAHKEDLEGFLGLGITGEVLPKWGKTTMRLL